MLLYFVVDFPVIPKEADPSVFSKKDRIDLAIAQEVEMTLDPALGYVPRERLWDAYRYAERMRQAPSSRAAIANVQWTERGPSNVGGRTRALMVDPADSTGRTVWAGGVAGGLWKTTDITATTPLWQAADDFFQNLAITCLAYDPANPDIRYFGTGEGYFSSSSVRGLGVWKSTDGGDTWVPLANTQNATFQYCYRIVVPDSGEVLVATRSGLQRSTDGGASWTKVLGGGIISNILYEIEMAANGYLYAAPSGSLHRSTDGGATWSAPISLPINADRIELACAPSDSQYLYALVELNNGVEGILRSTDGGMTWTSRNEPADADSGIPATDFTRGQGWYDLCIAVDPNNRDVLWVGGIDLFKSSDGGNTWNQVSHWWGGYGYQEVHADQHEILFEPGSSSVIYFGNDGGVYRTANGTAATPSLQRKEFGYHTTQFYACDLHPDAGSDHFLAGSQDNGTQRFSTGGINNTVEVSGGDGAFCHIDQNEPQFQFTSYVYNYYFRSGNGGNSFFPVSFSTNGRFINPTDYDDDANLLYAAENSGNYLRWNDPHTGNSRTVVNAGFADKVSAVTCDPNIAHRVYFGTGSGHVYRVDSAHTNSPVVDHLNNNAGMPSAYVSCIALEEGNTDHLLVTYSSYGVNSVWESTDGGSSWVSVEGNLPDMPVRWALISPHSGKGVLLATEVGVWSTGQLDGANTVWGPSNNGLANVRTDMLKMRNSDYLVIAATHGRGLFSSDVFMQAQAGFEANRKVVYLNKPVQFADKSAQASSWEWDFGDGNVSSLQNPVHSYATPGLYTVILSVNGGADADTQTNYIHVLPDRGNAYPASAGGDFESNLLDFGVETLGGTAFELGSSVTQGKQGTFSGSNAWVTGLSGDYVDNSETRLYTPNFDLSQTAVYTFRFRSRFRTEVGYDGFRVEFSLDKGDTWANLGGVQAFWYNFANAGGPTPFPTGQAYFNGDRSSAFNEYYYDVSALSGNSQVAFRFVFRSDPFVTDAGVAIDDVELENYVLTAARLQLEGQWKEDMVVLQWQWEGIPGDGILELQRSGPERRFVPVATFEESASSIPRTYTDSGAQERNFYRLMWRDDMGGELYSNVVELSRFAHPGGFLLYPNPAREQVWIELSLPATLTLLDLQGRKVQESFFPQGTHLLDVSGHAKGVYLLMVQEENGSVFSRKWVLE